MINYFKLFVPKVGQDKTMQWSGLPTTPIDMQRANLPLFHRRHGSKFR